MSDSRYYPHWHRWTINSVTGSVTSNLRRFIFLRYVPSSLSLAFAPFRSGVDAFLFGYRLDLVGVAFESSSGVTSHRYFGRSFGRLVDFDVHINLSRWIPITTNYTSTPSKQPLSQIFTRWVQPHINRGYHHFRCDQSVLYHCYHSNSLPPSES